MFKGRIFRNWKLRYTSHPVEDSFKIDDRIATVADGVTRDPTKYLPNTKNTQGRLIFILDYPKESPAKVAAETLVLNTNRVLRGIKDIDERDIVEAFREANNLIREYQEQTIPRIDYIINDFPGCVGATAISLRFHVIYGFICDSGVALVDRNGNLKFRTLNEGPDRKAKEIWANPPLNQLSWRDPRAKRIIRSNYRNSPMEPNSYGVFTGEGTAMEYVKTGTEIKDKDDTILVFTDGVENAIFQNDGDISGKAADKIRSRDFVGLEKLCQKNVRTEGTLVYSVG